jgi:hypothetical protein
MTDRIITAPPPSHYYATSLLEAAFFYLLCSREWLGALRERWLVVRCLRELCRMYLDASITQSFCPLTIIRSEDWFGGGTEVWKDFQRWKVVGW